MILLTHAIVGAATGRLVSNPWWSFVIGFISHFVIDAIPHWQYNLASLRRDENDRLKDDMIINRQFAYDLLCLGIDFGIGVTLSILIFQGNINVYKIQMPLLAGIIGGLLPDVLHFVYFKIRRQPLIMLEKLHILVNPPDKKLKALPYGIPSQILLIIAIIIISKIILK